MCTNWSHSEQWVVSSSTDKTARVWDVKSTDTALLVLDRAVHNFKSADTEDKVSWDSQWNLVVIYTEVVLLQRYLQHTLALQSFRVYYLESLLSVFQCNFQLKIYYFLQAKNHLFKKDVNFAQFYYMDKFILLTCGNSLCLYKYHIPTTPPDDITR